MNRACDQRADFYSLGAVLYKLLTGSPPFRSDDPLELIHWHIARVPHPPSEVNRAIPTTLSEIVMKLLAKTAEDLVDELFELAKLDFKGFEVNPEPVKLDELARDVAQKFSLAAEKKGNLLTTVIGWQIPFISANIGLIERAFENLLENALNHAKSAVTAEISSANGTVNVKFSDDDAGIAKDDLPLIFERFYHAEKSRNTPGAGLGLAITKRIVELHGGEIVVQSSVGEGTSFGFSLKGRQGTSG